MSEHNEQEALASEQPQSIPHVTPVQLIQQWGFLILIGGAILALDQSAKYLVVERLALGQSWEFLPQIGGFLRITHSYNTGAAFGLLPQASDIFLVLAIVTIIAFIFSYPKLPSHAWLSRLGVAMISGGALSNALDRIRIGHVTDYVHVQITPTLSNISNFADHAITVGVVLLLVDQWVSERRQTAEKSELPAEASSVSADEAGLSSGQVAEPLPVDNTASER